MILRVLNFENCCLSRCRVQEMHLAVMNLLGPGQPNAELQRWGTFRFGEEGRSVSKGEERNGFNFKFDFFLLDLINY